MLHLLQKKNANGNSALQIASYCGYHNIVLYLISNGADPCDTDLLQRSAFHYMCYRGRYESMV